MRTTTWWSEEELSVLRALAPVMNLRQIAARLQRTPEGVRRKAASLGTKVLRAEGSGGWRGGRREGFKRALPVSNESAAHVEKLMRLVGL